MKRQIRQNSTIAARLMAGFLISGVLCTTAALAQTKPPLAQKSDVWELHYWVTVRGDFKQEPELGSDGPTVFYNIKRDYEGAAKLAFSPRADDPKAAVLHPTFKDPAAAVHIKINDSRIAVYDPICEEFQRIEATWTAEVFSYMANKKFPSPALLLINNETHSYKTSFPILYSPSVNSNDVEYNVKEIMHLMSGENKVKTFPTEYQSLVTHGYPNVRGFIERASIIRAPSWSELKWEESFKGYSWVSEVLHPDEPLIHNVPESKDKVNILIQYHFIRVTG